jgi:hypothetical protein
MDIISMSWMEKAGEKKKAVIDLDAALEEAAKISILVFHTARGEGLEQPKEAPFLAASRKRSL